MRDGDYQHNGELYLFHEYEGVELDLKYVEKTIPYIQQLWGKTVHLETIVEDKKSAVLLRRQKSIRGSFYSLVVDASGLSAVKEEPA